MKPHTLPCIKDKCILLPVCKTKKFIECNKLKQYMDDYYTDQIIIDESTRDVYKYLLSIFNNLQGIYKDKDPNRQYIVPNTDTMYSTPNHPINQSRN